MLPPRRGRARGSIWWRIPGIGKHIGRPQTRITGSFSLFPHQQRSRPASITLKAFRDRQGVYLRGDPCPCRLPCIRVSNSRRNVWAKHTRTICDTLRSIVLYATISRRRIKESRKQSQLRRLVARRGFGLRRASTATPYRYGVLFTGCRSSSGWFTAFTTNRLIFNHLLTDSVESYFYCVQMSLSTFG